MVNQKACLEWCVVKTDFNAPGVRRLDSAHGGSGLTDVVE